MRCKKHLADLSSSVGVCATCLRECLFVLIAAQAQAQQHLPPPQLPPAPPHLAFPRSVSPYVARRKSDGSRDCRFYSTPQVGPGAASGYLPPSRKKKGRRGLSVLLHLFRSRPEKFDSDPDHGITSSPHHRSCKTFSSSSPSSYSWLSFVPGRRRGPSRLSSMADSTSMSASDNKKGSCVSDRGLSPVLRADSNADVEDRSQTESACSSGSPQTWRKTPAAGVTPASAAAAGRQTRPLYGRNMSGLAFCLSPLVRASPGQRWKQQKGSGLHREMGTSGETMASPWPHIAVAASACANRSRKLADFGRRMKNNR
ncbi:hypothetical protein SAY87_031202 [Trapa incisa]|uniref:Uncharacterized protein n=1 Tax=Trapa incisa TaxID=236973 RepID=A0AAN7KPQ2_9MYRT|nr:hypothetical protein SAY87_031202 [Trapa incisa]